MGQPVAKDLVLMVMRQFPDLRVRYDDREELARSLGLSLLTMRRTLTRLKKDGSVIKKKEYGSHYYLLTEGGKEEADLLLLELSNYFFIPEVHGVPASIRLIDVLKLINNPLFKGFLINLYFERDDFDLLETLSTFEMLEKDTSIYNLFESMEIFQNSTGMQNFVHSFMETTLFGFEKKEIEDMGQWKQKNFEVLLLEADLEIAKGRFDEGLKLYEIILQMANLPQDIWFIANIGRIRTYGKMGNRRSWENVLRETMNSTENKLAHGFLNQIEADLVGTTGDLERAKTLFESSIGTFRHFNYPIFLSIAYNNYGILMFNREQYIDAERLWKQARKYALEGGSAYLDAIVQTNLASIERLKGSLNKARKHLENASNIYIAMNNLENLSDMEFNLSLIQLSENDHEKALDTFNISMFDTFPFLSHPRREERLKVFKRECEKYKYTPIKNGPKFELVYIG